MYGREFLLILIAKGVTVAMTADFMSSFDSLRIAKYSLIQSANQSKLQKG
jgi:hypothetical protein